ncbi:MAG TPA: glycosyltransferase family 4 protein [Roseiflexaceae bacterium]|nr:glycosyltransferase family 4 protein [Roseiflexaceae bacterium]
MSKRWCYITAVRLAATSGQTTRIVESCRVIAGRRPTTLLAPAPPPAPLPGLVLHEVALPGRPPRELIFQARVARAVARLRGSSCPDVLYTCATAFNLGTILAARRKAIPAVLELNGLPALEYALERRDRSAGARALVYSLLARLEGRLASGIVAVTPQLAAEARRWGARAVHVAPNGVNPAYIVPHDRLAARRAHGLPADAEIVGFVGNFAAWQGLETLVRGVARLLPQRPALHLLLIGDGVERRQLERLAEPLGERVRFTGAQPHPAAGHLLAACDVLAAPLAPSERNRRTGVSPLKVFEYLALGRPVLASGLPDLEFIERERLGALFTPGDAADLARQLAALLDLPPAKRTAIGAHARAAAEERYSWERIMEGVITFVEGL